MVDVGSDSTNFAWKILVVDDESDIHHVTQLSLKRRTWRRRPFELTSCYKASEAREVLRADRQRTFHVAIVDVVMETRTAGLELCRYLRTEHPSSLRILLRTGQPGVAPEESVINDYDIDQYIAKTEVTPERLFSAIRTCLRSSQDIETLLAFHKQLRSFSSALPSLSTDADLTVFMAQGLSFLELKHQVHISFVKSIAAEPERSSLRRKHEVIARGHDAELTLGQVLPAEALGYDDAHVLLFVVPGEKAPGLDVITGAARPSMTPGATGRKGAACGGFLIEGAENSIIDTLQADLMVFVRNWMTAQGALILQQRVSREKSLSDAMHVERMERLTRFVTGLAMELRTPLDRLDYARSLISVAKAEVEQGRGGAQTAGRLAESTEIIGKNSNEARALIQGFNHLLIQLSDERAKTDLGLVIRECIEPLRAEAEKQSVRLRLNWPEGAKFPWFGVHGHIAHAVTNIVQNAIRYAYRAKGDVDVRLADEGDSYRLEIEDYGVGVAKKVVKKMLEPLESDDDSEGRHGLTITNHIVTRLLGGRVACTTELGQGTKFVITLPRDSSKGLP